MKKNKTNKTVVLLGFAVLLTAGLGGIYAFLFLGIIDQTKTTKELGVEFEELSNKESKLNLSMDLLKDRKDDIATIERSFIHESKIIDFPRTLEDLGVELGAKVTINTLDQVKISEGVWALGFQLNAVGSFADVVRFLNALENFPSKIEFSMINLSKTEGGVSVDPVTKKETVVPSIWTLSVNARLLNYLKD